MVKAYKYKHIVGFEETNLVGNVYYANHILWQGRTREMFLYEHAPDVIEQISSGLALVSINVSCQYISELFAFDHVIIAMQLKEMVQNRITMGFEYWRSTQAGKTLVAGLIQSPSQASLPGLSAWVEVGGIAPSLCLKAPPPQPIST